MRLATSGNRSNGRKSNASIKANSGKTHLPQQANKDNGVPAVAQPTKTTDEIKSPVVDAPIEKITPSPIQEAERFFQEGNIKFKENDFTGAILDFKQAIELNPINAVYHHKLGYAFDSNNQYQEAIRCYRKAIDLNPNNAVIHNNLGTAYYLNKQYPEAIPCYRKAIELNPNNAVIHNNLGDAFFSNKQYSDAIPCYRKAIDLNPNEAIYHNKLGLAFDSNNQYTDAIRCYRKAIELNPNNPVYYNNLGFAFYSNEQYPEAIPFYRKAIELNPNNAVYYNNLGLAFYSNEQYPEATPCFQKAVELNPNNTAYSNNLAILYRNLGVTIQESGFTSFSLNNETKINFHDEKNNEYSQKLRDQSISNFIDIKKASGETHSNDTWDSLDRGKTIINDYKQMEQYIFSFGDGHHSKLNEAFDKLADAFSHRTKNANKGCFHIIDWGCGQGIATMVFFDNFKEFIKNRDVNITLIEPSLIALERSVVNLHKYAVTLDMTIKTTILNKEINNIDAIKHLDNESISIHLFSNILDMDAVNIKKLADMIKRDSKGLNFIVCVSPLREDRLNEFLLQFSGLSSFIKISERSNPIPKTNSSSGDWKRIEKIFLVEI